MQEVSKKKSTIVGCGLVGSMMAHFLSKRGFDVEIYEKREDFRENKLTEGRSINLAMSERSREALRAVGLELEILKKAVPMKGRLLHLKNKQLKSVAYDSVTNQCLYSVSRNELNLYLLNSLDPKIKINFGHKLTRVDCKTGTATFKTNNGTVKTSKADLIIAADGAFSAVRQEIQKSEIFDFSQTYIGHGYLELNVDQTEGLKMVPNHLHIWPRGNFMMIALPNLDQSWTVTLFMPFKIFDTLQTAAQLIEFFEKTFPDFLNYCSRAKLSEDFFRKKAMPLISVKCKPFNFSRVVLVGDAAHAMVPFYGQGMNAGFEDCLILDRALGSFEIQKALQVFSYWRQEDAHVICDLAMYNYLEMRHLVATIPFLLRKRLDEFLYRMLGHRWLPLYNSVSFTCVPYKKCMENKQWQNKILQRVALVFGMVFGFVAFCWFFLM